jgi:hypothetical protein
MVTRWSRGNLYAMLSVFQSASLLTEKSRQVQIKPVQIAVAAGQRRDHLAIRREPSERTSCIPGMEQICKVEEKFGLFRSDFISKDGLVLSKEILIVDVLRIR